MRNSFSKHKQHGHHHKSRVMVPSSPLSDLVISHPTLAFGILKSTLNPKPLALHPSQSFKRGAFGSIAQGNLYVRIIIQGLGYNQSPKCNIIGFAIPYINLHTTSPNPEYPACCFSKRHLFPALARESLHKVPNFNALLVALVFLSWAARWITWQVGLGVFLIHPKIRMNIHTKRLTHRIKCQTKPGPLAISCVGPYPAIMKTVIPCMLNNFLGKVNLRSKNLFFIRYARTLTPFWIIRPFLGQIQAYINRGNVGSIRKCPKNSNLAVIDLAEATQPLTRNANRFFSLLCKAAFIYQQASTGTTQKSICVLGYMIDNISMIPFGMGQKLLKVARLGFRHHFGHPVHILTWTALHQTTSVLAGLIRDIMTVGLEMFCVAVHKRKKATPNADNSRRVGGCMRFAPLLSKMFPLALA